MSQRETDTNVITLTFGSKWRRFLEPIGHSASLLLVSKVKGQQVVEHVTLTHILSKLHDTWSFSGTCEVSKRRMPSASGCGVT